MKPHANTFINDLNVFSNTFFSFLVHPSNLLLSIFQRKKEIHLSQRPQLISKAFQQQTKNLDKATEASYHVSLKIAKAKKPHNIAEELIKPSCVDMVNLLCGEKAARRIQTIPLSDDTVKRRIDDMAENCEQQLLEDLANSQFAIQLDESTTVASEALLIVYVRYVNKNNELKNELLHSVNLRTTTRGEDIFDSVHQYFKKHNLNIDNLVGNKVVNLLKAKPLNARLFAELCIDEEHQTLLLHTEIRWLSRGRVLGRLFEMRDKVKEFLEQLDSEYGQLFENFDFLIRLAYLTDIFDQFNTVNLKLQGRDSTVIDCMSAMDSFCGRLQLWKKKLKRGETDMFPQVGEVLEQSLPQHLCKEFVEHLDKLEEEIQTRFMEAQHVRQMNFVVDPFSAETEDVSRLGNRAEEELLDLQHTVGAESFFKRHGYVKFWIEKGQTIAPTLCKIALNDAILPFATTYLAENGFSAVTHIKSKARNRLVIHNDLRLALTELIPNIESLCKAVQAQGSH